MSYVKPAGTLLGKLIGADMNSTADQAVAIASTNYRLTTVIVFNASLSLSLAVGGIYTAASKGGSAVIAATQVYTGLTAAGKFLALPLAGTALTDLLTATTLYLSLTTAQGGAATADFYLWGERYG